MARFVKGGTWRGLTGPRFRPVCPECNKKGLGPWKHAVTFNGLMLRECRYCGHIERRNVLT